MSTYNIIYLNTNIFKQFVNEATTTINVKGAVISNVPLSKCLFINNSSVTAENAHEQQFMYFANKSIPTTADDIVNYSWLSNTLRIENNNNDDIYMCIQGIADDTGNIKFIFDQHSDIDYAKYGLRWSSNYNVIFKLPAAINTSTYKLADNNTFNYPEDECICVSNNIEYITIDNVITLHQTNKYGVYKPPRIYAIGTEYDNYTYSFTVFTKSSPVELGTIIKNKMEITPNTDEYNYNIYQPNIISYEDRYKTTIHRRDYRDVFIVPIGDTPTLDISNTGDLTIYLDKLGKDPSDTDEALFNENITLTIGEGSAVNIVGDISDLSSNLNIELNGGTITYNGKEINEVNGPELYFKITNSNIDTLEIEPHPKLSLVGSLTSIQNNLTMLYNTITNQLEQGRKVSTITGESYDTGFTIGALSYDVKQYIESLVQPNEQQTNNVISYDYNVMFSVSDTVNIDNIAYSAVVITIDNTDYNIVGVFNNQFATLYTTGNDLSRSYHYVYTVDRTQYVFDTVHTESDIIATVNNKLTYRSKQVGYYTHSYQVNRKQSFITTIGDNIYFVSMA